MVRKVRASDPKARVRRKPAPVETRHVANARVWATALKLAEGDMTRVTVETFGRVSVTLP